GQEGCGRAAARAAHRRRRAGMRAPARGRAARGAPAGTGTGEGWLRRLAGYCWRYPRGVLLALGGTLLSTAVTAAIPLIQRDIVDNAILAHYQPIWVGATLLIVAALVNFGAVYVRRYQ